jgi:hypothetical protein
MEVDLILKVREAECWQVGRDTVDLARPARPAGVQDSPE